VSRFRASKEASKKSSSKIDEEGIQVAVCRYVGMSEECYCTVPFATHVVDTYI
jgi:hypothetical protein